MKYVYEIENGDTGEIDHFLHTSMEKALRSVYHDGLRIRIR
mgnify:CR=1 FL=1